MNRALCPLSKLAIGNWYEQTVLRRLWGFEKAAFSSQRFWDHMDRLSEEQIETLQEKVAARVEETFGLDAGLLLYDTTNFFTFIATSNDRCELAQRGRNKHKRHDLRQIGLALLMSGDFQIPLFHRIYPGHVPDVSLFPQQGAELIDRFQKVTRKTPPVTLVLDKGNVSDEAMENLVTTPTHFVAALPASRCAELMATPLEKFQTLPTMPGSRAFATPQIHWGKPCQAVVVYTESFFTQQLQGVTQSLVKCQKKLLDLGKSLERWRKDKGRGKKPTPAAVRKSVSRILAPQFMKELIMSQVTTDEKTAVPRLTYEVDHAALQRLTQLRLGRTVLVTDHLDWRAQKVVEAYRSLWEIEDAFKNMKNIDFLHWQPTFHWTDQKLRVHALYCVLALLISSLARKQALQAGINLSLPALLKELSDIREVAVIYPPGTPARPKDHITLSRMSSRQKKLADLLEIGHILSQKG